MTPWLVLSTSPRSHGNCEYAAAGIAQALRVGGALVDHLSLSAYTVAPCASCGLCNSALGSCSQDETFTGRPDHAAMLLEHIRKSAVVFLVSPIYFYGVPAQFKALIDRSQRYWRQDAPLSQGQKPAHALLLSGRIQGERLFDGSLLTLRPFLRTIGFSLTHDLTMRGLDKSEALKEQPELMLQIQSWAGEILRNTH